MPLITKGSGCVLQDRVEEEELGSLPSLPDGDGPDLHPRDRQGCAAYPGQEMLRQGSFCERKSNLFTLENTLRDNLRAVIITKECSIYRAIISNA